MQKIVVFKKNESLLEIVTESGIRLELKEYFSFFAKNYKFNPKFKAKVWDGRISVFDFRTSLLPIGLFYELLKFAEDRKYKLSIGDDETRQTLLPYKMTDDDPKILDSIPCKYELRDYQSNSILDAIQTKRRISVNVTGSGKSLVLYYMAFWFIQKYPTKNVLIVTISKNLVEQLYSDFQDYSNNDSIPDILIRRIHGESEDNKRKDELSSSSRITIATWQSLSWMLKKGNRQFFKEFGALFVDECHAAAAIELQKISMSCTESFYRLGFTGSLRDSKSDKMQLTGLFGPEKRFTSTKELQDKGQLAPLKIECVVLNYSKDTRDVFYSLYGNKPQWKDEIEFLMVQTTRHEAIVNKILQLNGNSLVLVNFIEKQGEIMLKLFEALNRDPKKKIVFIHGQTETEDREEIRRLIDEPNRTHDYILIATSALISTGVNIRNLHNIAFTFSTKSSIRVIQSIGRGLRVSDNQETTLLLDFIDDLRKSTHQKNSRNNYCLNHALERMDIYRQEQFNFVQKKIDIT